MKKLGASAVVAGEFSGDTALVVALKPGKEVEEVGFCPKRDAGSLAFVDAWLVKRPCPAEV